MRLSYASYSLDLRRQNDFADRADLGIVGEIARSLFPRLESPL
jgi:hypothetical protein